MVAMLFTTPPITKALSSRLETLDLLRAKLGSEVASFGPWLGRLRREVAARSVASSVLIEGFDVSHADAVTLAKGEESASDDENRMAISSYVRAMEHVGVMARDPEFTWQRRVILDLHFDACYFQQDKDPGLWRTGPISVTAGPGQGGGIAYQGPDGDDVPGLMAEVADWLASGDLDAHPVVRAAMAHLHVVSVHPFRDGNGRVSRIVQSLVLAREKLVSPEFGSIEEYLGDHTQDYYAALRKVQGGSYQPTRNASSWIAFCVDAHIAQAKQRVEQIEGAAARWSALEGLTEERGWPDRLVIALEQSLAGGSDRAAYSREADVSLPTASGDFRRLLDTGLIEQSGKGRSTRYVASEQLRSLVARR
jgi:Fic family protein